MAVGSKRKRSHRPASDPLDGTPELALFRKWQSLRRKAWKDRKYVNAMDAAQYQLQDMSKLGWSLVWGHEGRQRETIRRKSRKVEW